MVKDGDRENDREEHVVVTQRQDLIISIIKKKDRCLFLECGGPMGMGYGGRLS